MYFLNKIDLFLLTQTKQLLMKRILLALSLCAVGFSWGQREMDFATTILAPADNAELPQYQTVYFNLELVNQGTEDLLPTDSLYIYITLNGDLMVFQPGNMDHMLRTGNEINASETFSFSIPMGFADGFENTTNEMCILVVPVNAADEIEEATIMDNTDCVIFTVAENNAALDELSAESAVVYPNPAKEVFQISELVDNGIVELYNPEGKRVEQLSQTGDSFDISEIQNGAYLLKYAVNSVEKTTRLVVAH
jgi:hypothetical protein